MKSFFILAVLLLFSFYVMAQDTKDVWKQHNEACTRPKIGPVTVTGIVLVSTGPVISIVGLALTIRESLKLYQPGTSPGYGGPIILINGAGMTAAGIAMCIAGSIHDRRKAKAGKASLSITAPRPNEVGIA